TDFLNHTIKNFTPVYQWSRLHSTSISVIKYLLKMSLFELKNDYKPARDHPSATQRIVTGRENSLSSHTELGVTSSGNTITMANIIAQTQRPAIILAPNKTLAAQLYGEMKEFFPNNAVEYFVSYYDYYQPEAYVAASDTYIEKDASV